MMPAIGQRWKVFEKQFIILELLNKPDISCMYCYMCIVLQSNNPIYKVGEKSVYHLKSSVAYYLLGQDK
jgi:hypothetical protein